MATKVKPLPKGFKCGCKQEHRFPLYVYAHWDEELKFTCDKCQRVYLIYHGRAEEQ